MISNKEKEGCKAKSEGRRWHYLAVKKLHDDFYCLKISLSLMKKYVEIKISVELQCHQKRINYYSLINIWNQIPCIIYADIDSLIRKVDRCANNPESSPTAKIEVDIPCGYSMSTIQAFGNVENKYTLHCGEDSIKKFCESLREHAKI